ncbi:thioether cross-link-forming SCIFF peptide maturase [Anaerosalibacter bizertensis]|uniref:Thioether cross-link-forming SCIFF peptide maturase n=1 Tax=Anaerosalibacter bizertensis TaxID=932217 RepID=A0A9Q4AA31_9FIRM|nr:thioether cross-link-forming SCIFF peptide maturase [Anaerosalibacter bizertensis]MBV1817445.1 thioether cross-link-forming SCIFF peptide maturase [Bacteroidales bacterium MSK.15.36]MCB5559255.1 thioether cross-link-forming SCIFF peptide maturase [Anaerosalibacter bizertensis]MCG4564043.1 thioether cross-link-forming SCIFF peptide maturase [Anaerosalibacter bizertensis]MCG4581823.1 thioether cross-link-forming SCIFF peptide maturase [Anaerosalibacter bizertensis]
MLNSQKIHKFHLNNKYIVLDINSGAVHLVDEVAYDVLDYYENKDLKEIISELSKKYSKNEIIEAHSEITKIKEDGLLFSENINMNNFNYNNENIVKALCLHVAHDCNLRCKYCFASQGDFKGERLLMPLEVGKKALEFIVNSSGNRKNLEVDFFGGEPLMNFEVVKDLVAYGRELEKNHNKRFRFTITTNGVLLDEDKMEFINENMDNIVLSLDGRKEVNDNMRTTVGGKGSYDIIVPKFIEMADKRGDKDYFVRGTFTSNNLDFTRDALEFYNLGFKKISIEPVVTDPKEEYAIKEEHLDTILNEYEEFSKEYIKIKKMDKDFTFFHFMIDLNQGPCLIKRATGCGAGSEYMAVTPEGDLYPCHQFVGNDDFKLGDIFNGVINSDIREKFKQSNVFSKEECKTCWARFYCSGGCHANAYNTNKDITKPYKIGCEMEKKRIECAISILANLEE